MTARPLRQPRSRPGLRVIQGRRSRRPVIAPWMAFTLVVVVSFLGLVMARTALDRGAFELAELNQRITEAEARHEQLLLEVARLESPGRIAPLAEEMGLVYPEDRSPLLVEGVTPPGPDADPRWAGVDRLAIDAAPGAGGGLEASPGVNP